MDLVDYSAKKFKLEGESHYWGGMWLNSSETRGSASCGQLTGSLFWILDTEPQRPETDF